MSEKGEITVVKVLNDEGYCEVETDNETSVRKIDVTILKNMGFQIPGNKEKCLEWGQADTQLLLDLYGQYLPEVGPMKKFKNKKAMWVKISEDILQKLNVLRAPLQCETRYKTVLKRKRAAVVNNSQSGASPEPVEFQQELNHIKSLDDSVEPEILIGIGQCQKKRIASDNETSFCSEGNKSKRRKKSLSDVLYEIHQEKENNKEKRHQEKLALIKQLFNKNLKHLDGTILSNETFGTVILMC